MKTLACLCLLVLSSFSFASDVTIDETTLNKLEVIVKKNLKEDRNMEQPGYCDEIGNNQFQCTWYIEDTGRTPDTMNGVFEYSNGDFKLINAYEEYGC